MRHRIVLMNTLIAGSALALIAGCGTSGSPTSSASTSGGPVHGGNLVFNNPQDAQSMDESTVFDNNSIWILEQIIQPLYTVTQRTARA